MKITRISLTNFRSFHSTQSIDLASVTLLFGPNSVGKSSVLMALAYVQQILKKGHCDPQKLDALGDKSIGGFRALVHGQDLSQSIKIRLDFSSKTTPFVHYGSDVDAMANEIQGVAYLLMDDFGGGTDSVSVEFEIAWSERFKRAYVKYYRLWTNGIYVGCIFSSEDLKNSYIREINTQHPLLIPYNHDDWLEHIYGEESEREPLDEDDFHTEFEAVLDQLNPNPANTAAVADTEGAGTQFVNRVAPVSLACRSGAIPYLGNPVVTNLEGQDFDEVQEHFDFLVVRQVLSQAFVLPLDNLLEHLESSVQIGPLRVVPDNEYVPNSHPEQKDWVDGSAAWDLLYKDPSSNDAIKKLIRNTSEWFASSDKLDAGYEIINRSIAELSNLPSIPETMGLMTKRHVFFKELRTNILLSANQLGTGISQVLPLIVAANHDDVGLISIEQPELHIHPRFQVELADVFLKAKDSHSFLIETHSEHIVLRLLKRIRENNDDEKAVSIEDISITYLTPTPEGTTSQRLNITYDGDFETDWPHGFFDERDEELF
ncbi:AAA family ATPase [Vibrio campbellii]|nr:AAA family ATPase [Vibrio campbellii]